MSDAPGPLRLVVVGDAPPDVRDHLAGLPPSVELLHARDADEARAALDLDDEAAQDDERRLREAAAARLLADVRARVSRIYHDANNPLAIIAGNAQLLVELGRALELDEDLMQPIRDIHEASGQLADKLRLLVELRDAL